MNTENILKLLKILLRPSNILMFTLVLLLIGRYIFKLRYINCFDLIRMHILCFKKTDGKISKIAIILYFGIPLLLAVAVMQIRIIDDSAINIITIIISILTSMFFTLLTLILDMREKVKGNMQYDASEAAISTKILKETYYSIMFEILISIVILILCFIELFAKTFNRIESFVIYYLTFVMIINLFMILKRIFRVIERDLEK
ncbi:MAG: hypothetical protein Q4C84_00965 [Bacillota bacterium]|nr:hypothetical protein [Bacillota bacterium]